MLPWRVSSYLFFVFFAVTSAIAALAGAIATLETHGKSVEQIAAELGGTPSRPDQLIDLVRR